MIARDGHAVVFTGLPELLPLDPPTITLAPPPVALAAPGKGNASAAAVAPTPIGDKPLSLKQTISQLKKRLVVVERGIRERADLESERAAIHRLIEAAKAPGAEVRTLRRAL